MGQLQGKSVALRLANEALPPSYMACRNMKSVLLLQLASWEDKQVVESVRCLQQPKRVTLDDWPSSLQPLRLFSSSPSHLQSSTTRWNIRQLSACSVGILTMILVFGCPAGSLHLDHPHSRSCHGEPIRYSIRSSLYLDCFNGIPA